jgi:hypothetical protein
VHLVVEGFTPGYTSFLMMNPDFHFVLAIENLDKHEQRDILYCHVERRDQSVTMAEKAER